MENKPSIPEIVSKIVNTFHPRRVILFGSQARNESDSGSDIDLFIEMESDKSPPERAIEIKRLFGIRTWPLDIVVYTPQEVNKVRNKVGSLLSIIESEGRILYEQ
jgi:predicted nucleotidyltransferase